MENERLFVKLEMFLNGNFFQWNLIEMMECENIAEFQQMNEVVRFDQLSERGTKKNRKDRNMSRILNSIKYQRDKKAIYYSAVNSVAGCKIAREQQEARDGTIQ